MTTFAPHEAGTSAERWTADPRWAGVPTAPLLGPGGEPARRLVVVAAHPDDETLGAAGLLLTAHEAGLSVDVLVLTDGEASHPQSPTHSPERLAELRRREVEHAVHDLAPGARVSHAELPDGHVAAYPDDVVERLVGLLGDARHTLLVAPWRSDGHPDHEAAGRASAVAASRTGAALWEYPIWFWHWGDPDRAPWGDLVAVPLPAAHRAAKRAAVDAHRTQVAPLSDQPGDEVLLPPHVLAHFTGHREVFVREPGGADDALDDLHAGGREPWEADTRWYEQRKRDLLLAALPAATYGRALEVGCSTGVLAAALAERCDELVAVDGSPSALRSARRRLAGVSHAHVEEHDVPASWPPGSYDLVVVSELGYFLSPAALDRLVDRVRACLTRTGTVVLCHWRHEVVGWPLDGPAVHARFREAGLRPEVARYEDRDVEMVVLAPQDAAPDPTA